MAFHRPCLGAALGKCSSDKRHSGSLGPLRALNRNARAFGFSPAGPYSRYLGCKFVMPRPTRWTFSRYRRLYWDCGLDPYFRLQSGRKRLREETRARRYRKGGRPRIWTVRQAASAINSWGIAHGHFPEQAEYRNDESRPKGEWPATFKALQKKRLEDAAQNCDLPGAPTKITDSGVELLSNRQ